MEKQTVLTDEGLKKLEDELEYLKTVKRKEISEKIKVALSFGDLSENSEYDSAKNEQAIVEARIVQVEKMLKNAVVLDEDELSTDIVHIGSKVKVYDEKYDEYDEYHIVGSTEVNPAIGRISDESPIGSALINHKAGDVVEIQVPDGVLSLKIVEIFK